MATPFNKMEWLATGLICGVIASLLILIANRITGFEVQVQQVLSLGILYALAGAGWYVCFWNFFRKRYFRASLLMGALVLVLFGSTYVMVYGILAQSCYAVHQADVPFDWFEFLQRIFSGLGISGVTAGLVFMTQSGRRQERTKAKYSERIQFLERRLEESTGPKLLSGHFLRNLLLSVNSFAYTQSPKLGASALERYTHLLQYALEQAESGYPLVHWSVEWGNLRKLADLFNQIRGEHLVRLDKAESIINGFVPALVWLTLLENALIHGVGAVEFPIHIRLDSLNGQLVFTCKNAVAVGQRTLGSGRGLRMIREWCRHHFHEDYELFTNEIDGRYVASLTLGRSS